MADLEFRDLVSRPVWGHPAVNFYLHVNIFSQLLEKKKNDLWVWRSAEA